jgi:hypothetical protein
MRNSALRTAVVLGAVIGAVLAARTSFGRAQNAADECLIEFRDQNTGSLTDGASVMQTAVRRKCTFHLQLCPNVAQAGCDPAAFAGKKFHATGHCGPVAKLQVIPVGTGSACGAFTGITVRTKGSKEGKCTVSAAVRSAKTHARVDRDTVTLRCEP